MSGACLNRDKRSESEIKDKRSVSEIKHKRSESEIKSSEASFNKDERSKYELLMYYIKVGVTFQSDLDD